MLLQKKYKDIKYVELFEKTEGYGQNRTVVYGFAIHYITTMLHNQREKEKEKTKKAEERRNMFERLADMDLSG